MTESIAVIFGGPSDEHDISILTGLQSSRILSNKYEVKNFSVTEIWNELLKNNELNGELRLYRKKPLNNKNNIYDTMNLKVNDDS